jgi:hypothetical protein
MFEDYGQVPDARVQSLRLLLLCLKEFGARF